MSGLPIIEDLDDLSRLTRLSKGFIYTMSKRNNLFYKTFEIKKKAGGVRKIACPSRELKAIQAWILRNILEKVKVSPVATAFQKGKDILKNAELHKYDRYFNNSFFLCLDIEDFFQSIPRKKVVRIFQTLGYNSFISQVLASLCTYEDYLPQGGVTSPAISNAVCIRLDKRIAGYAGKRNMAYSRYADDITLSCMNQRRLYGAKEIVEKILSEDGFLINERKTRFLGPLRQRRITGLVMSDKEIRIGHKTKRLLRAKIYRLSESKITGKFPSELFPHLQGWMAFLKRVDPKTHEQLLEYARKLGLVQDGRPAVGLFKTSSLSDVKTPVEEEEMGLQG